MLRGTFYAERVPDTSCWASTGTPSHLHTCEVANFCSTVPRPCLNPCLRLRSSLMALHLERLSVSLPQLPNAVDQVSFSVAEGSAVGLVGESGAGKSLTALALVGLAPGKTTGRLMWRGRDLLTGTEADWARIRGREIALMVQSAQQALLPFQRVLDQVTAVALRHRPLSRKDAQMEALRLLEEVQFPDPSRRGYDYPHQLSGGMAQRAYMAMVLAARPALLIADEPTSALDAPVAAEIVAVLRRLRKQHRLSMLLISHDLAILASLCTDLVVLSAGRVVEQGPTQQLLSNPQDHYTQRIVGAARSLQFS